ncbi:MAG: purine-nucleoside phosphorylase, partial [Eubacteriales bacterium]
MITEHELSLKLADARNFLLEEIGVIPEIGIILGSGLGAFADLVKEKNVISYKEIPHFPVSTVEGHSGKLVIGKLGNKQVMVLQGRFHYYEKYEMHEVTFPVRVMQTLGIGGLVVTNAAGGINKAFRPGDLVVIKD